MPNALHSLDDTPAVSLTAAHHLHQAGVTVLIGALVGAYWSTGADLDFSQLLALLIIIFSSLPALAWAKKRRSWFPAFEISMLTCIAFYAVPLFKGSQELFRYESASRTQAAMLVIVYLLCANFGFNAVRRPVCPSRWADSSLLPQSAINWVPVGMILNVVYIYVSIYQEAIPPNLSGTLRALFFGLGIMSTFILSRMWGLQLLSRQQIGIFVTSLICYILLVFSTLYLIGGISLIALALIAYASARRKIPILAIAVFVPIVALLHLGKPEMRKKYWNQETNQTRGAPVESIADLTDYYTEWIGYSLEASEHRDTQEKEATSIFERASLIQMICLSVSQVPNDKPFLYGESYVDIPALVIPRLFWPDKPSSLMANIRLALYFNLVSEESVFDVSIAFGPLAEAYINFGYIGVGALGLIMGAAFKRISMLSDGAPQFSALGIFMILLTAWSFQAEQVMATWLSSLFQASVVCIGLPLAYRKLTSN